MSTALLFSDTFTEASNGVLLTAHTPDSGGGTAWANTTQASYNGNLIILDNAAARSQSATTQAAPVVTGLSLPAGGYDIVAAMQWKSSLNVPGFVFNYNPTTGTGYIFYYPDNSHWSVRKFTTGNIGAFVLQSFSSQPPNSNVTSTVVHLNVVNVAGTSMTASVYVDGLFCGYATDSSSPVTSGSVGLYANGTSAESGTVGFRWDSFQVWSNYQEPLVLQRLSRGTLGASNANGSDLSGQALQSLVPNRNGRNATLAASANYLLIGWELRCATIQDYNPADVIVRRVPRANPVLTAPGSYVDVISHKYSITNVAVAAGTATVTTSVTHNFTVGQLVRVWGLTNTSLNTVIGTNPAGVAVTGVTSTTVSFALAGSLGSTADAGFVDVGSSAKSYFDSTAVAVTNVARDGTGSSTSGTITTAAAHGFVVGQAVNVTGLTNAAWNSSLTSFGWVVTSVPTSTTFTFLLAGAVFSASDAGSAGSFAGGPVNQQACIGTRYDGSLVMVICSYPAKGGTGATSSDTWNSANCPAGNTGNTCRLYVITSSDEGVTWSQAVEITSQVKNALWGFMPTGPANIIRIPGVGANPTFGRLVCPVSWSVGGPSISTSMQSAVMTSDDNGVTWTLRAAISDGSHNVTSECTVALLKDGRVLWVGRPTGGSNKIANPNTTVFLSWSSDNGVTWTTPSTAVTGTPVLNPVCQSGVEVLPGGEVAISHPNNGAASRQNGCISLSTDGGTTWQDPTLPSTNYPNGRIFERTGQIGGFNFAYSSSLALDGYLYAAYDQATGDLTLARATPGWLGIASNTAHNLTTLGIGG